MAELRKSAKQTAARERAREKAATFRERQDKLETLAADYFEAVDQVTEAQRGASAVIGKMLELGANRAEVAERLGIDSREVRRAAVAVANDEDSPGADNSAAA